MAAPSGRIWPVCKQFGTRFLCLKRHVTIQKCMSSWTVKQLNYQVPFGCRSMNNGRNYMFLCPSKTSAKHNRLGSKQQCTGYRCMSSAPTLSDEEVRKQIETITDKFMEAKEYLEDAKDSIESVYFDEDMKDAEDAINDTLDTYQELLSRLTDEQKQNVTRTIGLKMEELKAQLDMIKESLRE